MTFDLKTMMNRKVRIIEELARQIDSMLQTHQVDILHGNAVLDGDQRVIVQACDNFAGQERILQAPQILLATGSTPVTVEGLEPDHHHIIDSGDALSLAEVPDDLLIVGAGSIGLELGSVWQRLGARVQIVEIQSRLSHPMDDQTARTLQHLLTRQGLTFHFNARVRQAAVQNHRVAVTLRNEAGDTVMECDKLLVAIGRKPLLNHLGLETVGLQPDRQSGRIAVDATCQTDVAGIYAIGDLIDGPMLAHKASAEGIAAVECMAGLPGNVNYDTLPFVTYTEPEVAGVGLTEAETKMQNIPYRTETFSFTGVGRAWCRGKTEGFTKMIAHSETNRILGVHIIGPQASELIGECVLAMEFGAGTEDLARTVHSHPTLSEGIQQTATRFFMPPRLGRTYRERHHDTRHHP
jgi:dihydrolipoamide dehydrogenase